MNNNIRMPMQQGVGLLHSKDGDKVVFLSAGGKIVMENSTKLAIRKAQATFAGLAEELGIETEEDVINLVKEVRQEMREKKHANNEGL